MKGYDKEKTESIIFWELQHAYHSFLFASAYVLHCILAILNINIPGQQKYCNIIIKGDVKQRFLAKPGIIYNLVVTLFWMLQHCSNTANLHCALKCCCKSSRVTSSLYSTKWSHICSKKWDSNQIKLASKGKRKLIFQLCSCHGLFLKIRTHAKD